MGRPREKLRYKKAESRKWQKGHITLSFQSLDQGLGENSELAEGMLDALVTGKGDCSISVNLKKRYQPDGVGL